ncbi:ABC transporter ATP-binding protein [Moorena producens JHB]|uniref:ABC transporter ATP-binding protein n=1 Tax=Moorena producens (strain JHB) TaxID=1454205 RepID=A0A1D9G1D5_MOOP1|nr:ABC transporter ATP-binding protein [Moorena producens]AOY81371.1 ABC transporter ATP-binding protein [Moorena producens JHB]
MVSYLSNFLYILGERKLRLIPLLLLILLTSLLDTVGIGLVGPFMGLATNPRLIELNSRLHWVYVKLSLTSEVQFIALLGLIIIVAFWTKSLLSFQAQKYIFKFSFTQYGELSSNLLHAYLVAPYTFHLRKNTAFLINTVLEESGVFSVKFMIPFLKTVASFIIILFLVILLIITDPIATITLAFILLIPLVIIYQFKDQISEWGKKVSQSKEEMIRIINHSLGGLKETRIIGCESYFERQMSDQVDQLVNGMTSFHTFQALPRIIIEAILVTFLVAFVSLVLVFNLGTENIIEVLGIFALASVRMIPAFSHLTSNIALMRNSSYSINKIYLDLKELEDMEVDKILEPTYLSDLSPLSNPNTPLEQFRDFVNSIDVNRSLSPEDNQIEIDRITYRYPKVLDPTIMNISLTINKGQSIALIGKSGSGKTTLVDVILGLLAPESGEIRYKGKSIYNNLRSWQNLIGYIPQSIFLIDDTIEGNIAFGVPKHLIDRERLHQAIQSAQLAEFVEQLPEGVNSVVGERGVRLSGGQRQRIGIARALYHQREILVLDEATSALDNETEHLVNEAIKSLNGTKTMIIIAHRLSTIEHCDCIYLLDQGRLVKSGTYQDMILNEQSLNF